MIPTFYFDFGQLMGVCNNILCFFLQIDSVDVLDPLGSNIVIATRTNEVLRILPRTNEVS